MKKKLIHLAKTLSDAEIKELINIKKSASKRIEELQKQRRRLERELEQVEEELASYTDDDELDLDADEEEEENEEELEDDDDFDMDDEDMEESEDEELDIDEDEEDDGEEESDFEDTEDDESEDDDDADEDSDEDEVEDEDNEEEDDEEPTPRGGWKKEKKERFSNLGAARRPTVRPTPRRPMARGDFSAAVREVFVRAKGPLKARQVVDALPEVGIPVEDEMEMRKRISVVLASQKKRYENIDRGLYRLRDGE